VGYLCAQLIGASLAGLAIILAVLGDDVEAATTTPIINGAGAALASEIILTFFLTLVVLAVATDHRAQGTFAAIAVGGFVAVAAIGWAPVAGASMNPARSFCPALAANVWDEQWVYRVAPITGAAAAVAVYELLREPPAPEVGHRNGGGKKESFSD
jgi:glycerol uptake facilitator-like aquaporin